MLYDEDNGVAQLPQIQPEIILTSFLFSQSITIRCINIIDILTCCYLFVYTVLLNYYVIIMFII